MRTYIRKPACGIIKYMDRVSLPIKSIIVTAAALLVLAAAFWFSWLAKQPKSYELAGRIERIEGNSIFLNGVYQVPDRPDLTVPENAKEVEVVVTAATRFVKTVLYLPSAAELEKTGGMYRPDDLRREEVAGAFDDIKNGGVDGIFAAAGKNVYGKSKFEASEVRYISAVAP